MSCVDVYRGWNYNIYRCRDDARRVTCWARSNGGVSCLRDEPDGGGR